MFTDEEFKATMDKYGDTVLRICYVRLRNLYDAQDAFQDVFISLYNAKNKPEGEHILPWLIKTACNRCVSVIRLRKHSVELTENIAATEDESDKKEQIAKAMLTLNRSQRTVVYLFYFENMKTAEIAESMGISESNVRVLLHRGREKLKAVIKEEDL